MNKAIASLKKDLGDWDFSVSFYRDPDGYASGLININGNDRIYACGFEDDYMDEEEIYDARTGEPIRGVW